MASQVMPSAACTWMTMSRISCLRWVMSLSLLLVSRRGWL
jgi:hypothetical protein